MGANDTNNMTYIDYKDIEFLKKFLNQHARIQSKRKSGIPAREQRMIDEAIKRARFMGLLPYVSR
jgi:small subunit ribosomal protein S18